MRQRAQREGRQPQLIRRRPIGKTIRIQAQLQKKSVHDQLDSNLKLRISNPNSQAYLKLQAQYVEFPKGRVAAGLVSARFGDSVTVVQD
jgi:hypothetical protein